MKHTAQRTIALTVAALATGFSGLTATAAVASPLPPEPQHNGSGQVGTETSEIPSKAAIEHYESLAQSARLPHSVPSKAAVEHQESLARSAAQPAPRPTDLPTKAAIEHQEALVLAAQPSESLVEHYMATPAPQPRERSDRPVHTSPQPVAGTDTDWVPDVKAVGGVAVGLVLIGGIALLIRQLHQGQGSLPGTA